MIKLAGFPFQEREIKSLMIGMATGATPLFVSVESFPGLDPLGQFDMTGQAFFIDRSCSRRVALGAIAHS